jgi:hypothetical protein
MCLGCGVPCGGACGTNDWEEQRDVERWVSCETPNCEFEDEVDGSLEITGRGSRASGTFHWTCPLCKVQHEDNADDALDDDFDPPEPDNYYY